MTHLHRLARAVFLGLVVVGQAAAQEGDALASLAWEGRWDDIIVLASERLDEQREDPPAAYWLGRAWLARAEGLLAGSSSTFARDLAGSSLDRAIDQLESLAAAGYGDAREWFYYARYLREDSRLAPDLESWFEADGSGYAAFLRGRVAQRDSDQTAVDWFRLAVDATPERGDYSLALCDQLMAEGRSDEALAAWQGASAAGVPASALLMRLLSLLPEAEEARRRLELIEKLVRERGLEKEAVSAWYRAHALEQVGRAAEAERVLSDAVEGRSSAIDRAHASLLGRLGRDMEAVERLRSWVSAGNPDAVEALTEVADGAAQRGKWSVALMSYDHVLEHAPNHERALRNRALTQWRAGHRDLALEGWRDLAGRWPGRSDVLNDAALFLWVGGQAREARGLWEQALEQPGGEDAAENLAVSLLASDPVRAQELLGSLLDTNPTRDRALYHVHRTRRASLR